MKNHYIQKEFIKNFCGDNGILIYDIIKDKFLPRQNTINNIAVENDLYHFENIDYPDDQIEKDLKAIEDIGLDIIRTIAETEILPIGEDLHKLIAYLYYQALRTPYQKEFQQEEISKLNKINNTNDFNDLALRKMYNKNLTVIAINAIINEYNIYLLKQNEPNFFVTDCFCDALQNKSKKVIPITNRIALYFIPKNCTQGFHLTLKRNVANLISFKDYFELMALSAQNYKRFAFTSYTELNRKFLLLIYKSLQKFS
ncbi:MAG: DUF4238 domain-containing protein [Clostridiales bacterium]|nr:DUF4238 domain-containing protein [Clostridiales bacterium]